MTLNKITGAIMAVLFISSYQGYAGTMGATVLTPGKIYVSAFGGAGAADKVSIKQFGTVFFPEAVGGPLAVDAFGRADSGTVGLVGGHVGYQWSAINLFNSRIGISPATELEGYYLGKATFTGHAVNYNTLQRLERDFLATYPVNTGVFLINAVANIHLANQAIFYPYVGAGIGAGVLSIADADSLQVSPREPGINHYNSNRNSSNTTFAAQVKAGLSAQLTSHIDIFGEYRWLYLASSHYTFGSTVYPTHAATSSWLVKFGSQNYNLGAVGLRYSI
ncbi:outer membrane protein [Legionella lytica]|uniref:Outer membrane protein n=1 Tax=Legionella lytica TaxID=96232 RepID=A0ABW8DER0_9GAMM